VKTTIKSEGSRKSEALGRRLNTSRNSAEIIPNRRRVRTTCKRECPPSPVRGRGGGGDESSWKAQGVGSDDFIGLLLSTKIFGSY